MTLNQIIKRVQTIAETHEQINTFYFGDVDDFFLVDRVFPACFMGQPSESVSNQTTTMRFSLYFLDRQIQGGSGITDNTAEVLSDCREIALDIFSQMAYQKFDPRWNLSKDAVIEYFNETNEDYLAGTKLDVSIEFPFSKDRCAVPSTLNLS